MTWKLFVRAALSVLLTGLICFSSVPGLAAEALGAHGDTFGVNRLKTGVFDVRNDDPGYITVGSATRTPGESVDIDIDMKFNPGIAVFAFNVTYNPDVFSLADAVQGAVGKKYAFTKHLVAPGKLSILLKNTRNTIYDGTLITLKFNILDDAPNGRYGIDFEYSKGDIVDENGNDVDVKVTPGTITVRADPQYILTSITLNERALYLYPGDTFKLIPTIKDERAEGVIIDWVIDIEGIASVDNQGNVKALFPGTCELRAIARQTYRAVAASCYVNVLMDGQPPTPPKKVYFAKKTIIVAKGQLVQLQALFKPIGAFSAMTWKSSKPKIALVDANGLVTGNKKGKAKITVKTANSKKATITIKVTK